jgi:hypothetical protein
MHRDAMNKVAEKGGTHIKIVSQGSSPFSGAFTTAEAYKCLDNY